MRVSGSQLCAQKISIAGEAKQGMVADLLEVTVEGCTLLLSVDGVFSGINIDDEPPFVSTPKEGFGGPAERIFEGLQSLTRREDLVLESAKCGLAGSVLMLFAQGQSERRVHPQVIGDHRVAGDCCQPQAPLEPCVRLSPHTARASRKAIPVG